jgi:hypothetical protein
VPRDMVNVGKVGTSERRVTVSREIQWSEGMMSKGHSLLRIGK